MSECLKQYHGQNTVILIDEYDVPLENTYFRGFYDEMLDFYEMNEKKEVVKRWYDGYQFGKTEVYNPWSVINYVNAGMADCEAFPKAYWSNTSSNSIIRELVETGMSVEFRNLLRHSYRAVLVIMIEQRISIMDIW